MCSQSELIEEEYICTQIMRMQPKYPPVLEEGREKREEGKRGTIRGPSAITRGPLVCTFRTDRNGMSRKFNCCKPRMLSFIKARSKVNNESSEEMLKKPLYNLVLLEEKQSVVKLNNMLNELRRICRQTEGKKHENGELPRELQSKRS